MTRHMQRPGLAGPGAPKSIASGDDNVSVPGQCDPYGQLTLEDALRARDRGMQDAEHATDVAWRQACDRIIAELAATGDPFDAETVRERVGPPVAASPNALGARFAAAARAGVIVPAGYRQATRSEAHGRILRRWVGAV